MTPLSASRTFKFAVNPHGINKDWNFRTLSGKFQDIEGTFDEAIAHIQQGHAICAGLLNGQWRKKANFAGSNWVLAEIDNATFARDDQGNVVKGEDGKGIKAYHHQMTIEEAIAYPLIAHHCALIYTTPSHTKTWHQFRSTELGARSYQKALQQWLKRNSSFTYEAAAREIKSWIDGGAIWGTSQKSERAIRLDAGKVA